jgi:hypothetical protein
VRDGLEERVLHLVERAQPLRGLTLAAERLAVLAFGLAQRLLGALAFGDVDHETAHALHGTGCVPHRVHQVADPCDAAVGLAHAILRGRVVSELADGDTGLHSGLPVLVHDLLAPGAVLVHPCLAVRAEEVRRPGGQEGEDERVRARLPEDGVEALHELVEPLELREAARVAERERGDVGDAARQPDVLLAERGGGVGSQQHERAESVRFPSERRDEDLAGLAQQLVFRRDLRDDLARHHERLGDRLQELLCDLGRHQRGSRQVRRAGADAARAVQAEGAGLVLAHVRRDGAGRHEVGDRLHRLAEDLVDRVESGQRLREPQQRRRGLRRLALGLEELRVADGDRRVRGQHLEQPPVLLVELPVPEARQHDRADRLGPGQHRHRQHGFEDVVGARDHDGEVDLAGVGREQALLRGGHPPRDALAHLGGEVVDRLLAVLGGDVAAERDRQQRPSVGLEHVHAAVVVVDDRAELGRDGGADLLHLVQAVELGGEAVQHVQLGDGPDRIPSQRPCRLVHRLDHARLLPRRAYDSIISPPVSRFVI